jgi:effector-binding domain-containing protein
VVVDIKVKKTPSYKVASMMRVGPWSQNVLRAEFGKLMKYAKKHRLRTGKWFFYFLNEPESARGRFRAEACLQISGRAKTEGKIKVKKLPKMRVASVTFNPKTVSPGLVYSGLYGWTRYAGYRRAGASREVYIGNPWTNARAWANCEVQMPIKRK